MDNIRNWVSTSEKYVNVHFNIHIYRKSWLDNQIWKVKNVKEIQNPNVICL